MNGSLEIKIQKIDKKKITQNIRNKKSSSKKRVRENTNLAVMYILTSFALIFFTLTIIYIFTRGANAFGQVDGLNWSYFVRGDYYAPSSGFFPGFLLMVNSIWATLLTVIVAVPIAVMMALFITKIVPESLKTPLFAVVALLAAVPSVIFGSFGSNWINTMVYNWSGVSGPLISIIFTLSIMIIPTITLITATSINNVDRKMEMSSLALGATKSQTTQKVTLRSIRSGILTGTLLGLGRALGEASAVSMVAGETNSLPSFGLFENIRLITSSMLKGWGEIKGTTEEGYTFSLAMILMITVLIVFFIMKTFVRMTDVKTIETKEQRKTEKQRISDQQYKKGLENYSNYAHKNWLKLSLKRRRNKLSRDKFRENSIYYKIYSDTKVKKIKNNEKRRKSFIFSFSTFAFAALGFTVLIGILIFLLDGGVGYLNWDFLTTRGRYDGEVNGLAIPIMGTFITLITALAFTIPIGLFAGIYFSEYSKRGKISNALLYGIELLSSVPSMIMGLIGFVLFVPLSNAINFAPLSGGLILTFIVLPTVVKTTEESVRSVNRKIKEGSASLGATKSKTTWKVSIPQAMPGITSGLILSAGRMLGESAALVMIWGTFSRSSAESWIANGGTTLATEIYRLTGDLQEIPWEAIKAIGIVIITIILLLTIMSNYIKDKKNGQTILILSGIILMLIGILVPSLTVFIIGLIITLLSILMTSIILINNFFEERGKIIIPAKIQYKFFTRSKKIKLSKIKIKRKEL